MQNSLQSLITFVNKHLNKLHFEVTNLNADFKDGVYLCLLMGLLGGFFVPLYDFHLTPKTVEHMVNSQLNSYSCTNSLLFLKYFLSWRCI